MAEMQRKRTMDPDVAFDIDNSKRSRTSMFYCPHCQQVSKTAFYNHRAQYYQEMSKTWLEQESITTSSVSSESFQLSNPNASVTHLEDSFQLSEETEVSESDHHFDCQQETEEQSENVTRTRNKVIVDTVMCITSCVSLGDNIQRTEPESLYLLAFTLA